MFLYWQNQLLQLVLPTLLFFSITIHSQTKFSDELSHKIIHFTLFNYDNIIADYYENKTDYIEQIVYLISIESKLPPSELRGILFNDTVASEPNAVLFMLEINKRLKSKTGFYFVDQ